MRYIARFNPMQEIVNLQDTFERAFDIRWRQPASSNGNQPSYRLPLDVFEQENAYLIVASLPGATAADIQINLEDEILSIQATVPQFEAGEELNSLWRERRFGQFQRQLRLPAPIQREEVAADFADGVLRLTLPKAESVRVHQIPVRSLHSNSVTETA